jgi:hypothetical protein
MDLFGTVGCGSLIGKVRPILLKSSERGISHRKTAPRLFTDESFSTELTQNDRSLRRYKLWISVHLRKRMKRIDLGGLTQILANIGVISGIVFLGFEIRQNTTAVRSQASQGGWHGNRRGTSSLKNSETSLRTK